MLTTLSTIQRENEERHYRNELLVICLALETHAFILPRNNSEPFQRFYLLQTPSVKTYVRLLCWNFNHILLRFPLLVWMCHIVPNLARGCSSPDLGQSTSDPPSTDVSVDFSQPLVTPLKWAESHNTCFVQGGFKTSMHHEAQLTWADCRSFSMSEFTYQNSCSLQSNLVFLK